MTGLPVEWVAGAIDARGHIEVNDRHGRPQPRVRVTTARTALLHRLADLTGTTVKTDHRGYQRRPCGTHCQERHSHVARQSAYWTVDSARATIVLANVAPHLIAQKMASLGWEVPCAITA